jgi:pyridoxine 5-phosphate synthase
MSRVRLGVNVDHVATLRQARGTRYPDPVTAAAMSELAGADQITIHLREDRRHIQDRDLRVMRETIQTRLNLEMAATDEMLEIALSVKPDTVTLVPERREEQTTEHGLDAIRLEELLSGYCQRLAQEGIDVSLFIDADLAQIDAAARLGVHAIELHTGEYADAVDDATMESELHRLELAAEHAHDAGLMVAAGHGLDYVNVREVAAIDSIEELNIGHALVSRAVLIGMEAAVREMIVKMHEA